MFRALSSLEETLTGMRALDSGHLRLAVSSTGKYFAPRLLGAFIQRYPGSRSIAADPQPEHADRAARETTRTTCTSSLTPPDQQEVVVQAILPNPLVVFARDDHPLAGEKDIAFERLASEPFLMREPGSGNADGSR